MSRRLMLRNTSGGSGLPSEYQQVKWIRSDGACRIDSGVTFDGTRDFNAIVVAQFRAARDYSYFGWNAGGIIGSLSAADKWYNGGTISGLGVRSTIKTSCEIVIEAGSSSNTINTYTNLEPPYSTQTLTRGHQNVENRLYFPTYQLFATSNSSDFYYTNGGCTIYDALIGFDGSYESHLVPCYSKVSGEIGMYDVLKRVFRPNLGEGSFTKGADVN